METTSISVCSSMNPSSGFGFPHQIIHQNFAHGGQTGKGSSPVTGFNLVFGKIRVHSSFNIGLEHQPVPGPGPE